MLFKRILLAFTAVLLSSFLWSQDLNMQNGTFNQCSGMLYDSGGPDENYGNNEDYTLTICPDNDEDYSQLDFSEFNLSPGDELKIYNSDTADPDFLVGTYTSGNTVNDLGKIKATSESPSHCLTLVFTSNASGNSSGFAAEISCTDNNIYLDQQTQHTTYHQCSGKLFDHEGATIYNLNHQTRVTTICPGDDDLVTQIDFLNFVLAQSYSLKIYDGPNTNAPLIGTYAGNNNPGTIAASGNNLSGCLTFEYTGGNQTVPPTFGFEADINCVEPCQQMDISIADIEPSIPNPGPITYNGQVFDGYYQVPRNQTVTYTADVDFEINGDNATYTWDFSGSITGPHTSNVRTHTFTSEGFKIITLTVTDEDGCSYSYDFLVEVMPNTIKVYDDLYTVEELVKDVLIGNDCAYVTNVTYSDASMFGQGFKSIGYFDGNFTTFPINEGLLLSSGKATEAEGPETGTQSFGNNNWPGDNDLQNALPGLNSRNATIIEFDFISLSNQLTFNFLFASEEYGTFQCTYSDAFAFLLTDSDGNTTNLAVVPNTTPPVPVAVTTIRDNQYNTGCPSENIEYFGNYYGGGGLSPADSPTNFLGHTVRMTASSPINPGEEYHIKLVIADHGDTNYDSGVFLEAGSFDIGEIDLGPDISYENENTECDGETIFLDSGIEPFDGAEFIWYKDGVVIPGADGPTLEVTEPGNYTVEVDVDFLAVDSDCLLTDTIIVEFSPTPVLANLGEPEDLFACTAEGVSYEFNLTDNEETILNEYDSEDFVFSYYTSEADAEALVNQIDDPEHYDVECEEVWVRIEGIINDELTGCFAILSFEVCTDGIDIGEMDDLEACYDEVTENAFFDLTLNEDNALDEFSGDDFSISYYTDQDDATQGDNAIVNPENYEHLTDQPGTIYVRTQDDEDEDCYDVA